VIFEHRLRRPFPAAEHRPGHRHVRHHHVHGVLGEPRSEPAEQDPDRLAVGGGVLRRGAADQVRGADRVPVGQERQRRHPHRLPGGAGRECDQAVADRAHRVYRASRADRAERADRADRAEQVYPGDLHQGTVGVEGTGVVVVARDGDHLGPGGAQRQQGADDRCLGLGRRCGRLIQVARHQHGIDVVLAGDIDDLG
jgi:hypothetical protein